MQSQQVAGKKIRNFTKSTEWEENQSPVLCRIGKGEYVIKTPMSA